MRKDNFSIQKPAVPTVSHIGVLAVEDYISSHNMNQLSEADIASGALESINNRIDIENSVRSKEEQISKQKELTPRNISQLMSVRDDLVMIVPTINHSPNVEDDYTSDDLEKIPFGVYQKEGKTGIYVLTNSSKGCLAKIVRLYNPEAKEKDVKEVIESLRDMLKVVTENTNPMLVAVNNGIWNMDTKNLIPFSNNYVFTSKICNDLNTNATNPIIHLDNGDVWDVHSWFDSLGSKDFVFSLWENIQACCLNYTDFDKLILWINTSGANGKSTVLSLIRSLLGANTTVSIPMHKFSERFGVPQLVGKNCVLCDENPNKYKYKDLTILKKCVTHDVIEVEPKFKDTFNYVYHGLIIQACNEYPNFSGGESFERRLFILKFENSFLGEEKKYIKSDLVHRKDVLEYVLKVCLVDMDYRDRFTETELTKATMLEYLGKANPVATFLEEILPKCSWDLLPASALLYPAFIQWFRAVNPSESPMGRNEFLREIKQYINTVLKSNPNYEWEWTDCTRWEKRIDITKYEPIVDEYDIEPFKTVISIYSRGCSLPNLDEIMPNTFSGLKRRNTVLQANSLNVQAENEEEEIYV